MNSTLEKLITEIQQQALKEMVESTARELDSKGQTILEYCGFNEAGEEVVAIMHINGITYACATFCCKDNEVKIKNL